MTPWLAFAFGVLIGWIAASVRGAVLERDWLRAQIRERRVALEKSQEPLP